MRVTMGIPADWNKTANWLSNQNSVFFPNPPVPMMPEKKCPSIPVLSDYNKPAPANFWGRFPSNSLPSKPQTPVNSTVLKNHLHDLETTLCDHQIHRLETVIQEIESGVSVLFSHELPAIKVPNTSQSRNSVNSSQTCSVFGSIANLFLVPFRFHQSTTERLQIQCSNSSASKEQNPDRNEPFGSGGRLIQ